MSACGYFEVQQSHFSNIQVKLSKQKIGIIDKPALCQIDPQNKITWLNRPPCKIIYGQIGLL